MSMLTTIQSNVKWSSFILFLLNIYSNKCKTRITSNKAGDLKATYELKQNKSCYFSIFMPGEKLIYVSTL